MESITEIARLIQFYEKYIVEMASNDKITDIKISVGNKLGYYMNRQYVEVQNSNILSTENMQEIIYTLCDYSVYKHMEEIKQGFISVKNKHRVGICGTAVIKDGKIENIKDIRSINIRISREVKNASLALLRQLPQYFQGLLIVGEPSSGKTTLLKDLILKLDKRRICVIDERGELTKNNTNANIMFAYPKIQAISQSIRNLGSEIIICDELEEKDIDSVKLCANSGVSLISTVHGSIKNRNIRPLVKDLIETGAFEYIVFLEGRDTPCKVKKIIKVGEIIENNGRLVNNNLW